MPAVPGPEPGIADSQQSRRLTLGTQHGTETFLSLLI